MQRGVHVYGTYGGPDFDAIAERTIGPDNARLLRLTAERRRKRIRRGVEWLHRQTAGRCLSSEQSAWLASRDERVERAVLRAGTAIFKP
jgi:hypothetical protein